MTKAQKENNNQNIYEQEIIIQGNRYACLTFGLLATLFFIVQIFIGKGINYGLYAVVFSMPMAGFWYKYRKLHKKHELLMAISYTVMVTLFSFCHIYQLINSSVIL